MPRPQAGALSDDAVWRLSDVCGVHRAEVENIEA